MTPSPPPAQQEEQRRRAWRCAARRSAFVAAVFSGFVGGLLAITLWRTPLSRTVSFPALEAMRERVKANPGDEALLGRLRRLDRDLREDLLRRQRLAGRGVWLLLGGVGVFLLSLHAARHLREEEPERIALLRSPRRGGGAAERERTRLALGGMGGVFLAVFLLLLWRPAPALRVPDPAPQAEASAGAKGTGAEGAVAAGGTVEDPARVPPARRWPRFRGADGLGHATAGEYPASWNGETGENVLWKVPVPLPGENSPVVWGRRIFLTGATEAKREVYCFDAGTGKMRWSAPVRLPASMRLSPPAVMAETGFAAPTAATDGRGVYAVFANGDLAAFSMEGEPLWSRHLGAPENAYGHASSLLPFDGKVIVLYDQGFDAAEELSRLFAFDAATGEEAWQITRPVPNSWGTPIVYENPNGAPVLVTVGNPWVLAYDPATGQELWRAKGLGGDVAPSPVVSGGLVLACNVGSALLAIRTGGFGDVTGSQIAWTATGPLPDTVSPVADGERVLLVETYGTVSAFALEDGEPLFEEIIESSFNASPVQVGQTFHLIDQKGVTHVLRRADAFEVVATHPLGETVNATPAYVDGCIYIRAKKHLYAIGTKR